jgi:hypothetical protein
MGRGRNDTAWGLYGYDEVVYNGPGEDVHTYFACEIRGVQTPFHTASEKPREWSVHDVNVKYTFTYAGRTDRTSCPLKYIPLGVSPFIR